MNILFDGLNNESVPQHAVDQMIQIAKGMSLRKHKADLVSDGCERCQWRIGNARSAVDGFYRRNDRLGCKSILQVKC